jgi:3-phosphoshikimate 1-carboxyvinyltransferase
MVKRTIYPSKLAGEITVPPSKSQTLRAILFASLARGVSRVERFLESPDVFAMIEAVKLFGTEVSVKNNVLEIHGKGLFHAPARNVIDCGNSGIVLRFLGAVASLLPSYTVLTGDESIRTRRLSQPLLDGLSKLGAFAVSARGDGFAPLIIRGPWTRTKTCLDGADSQPVSGLLIAGALAPHPVEIEVQNPGEKPWIDLTLHWLKKFNLPYEKKEDYTHYKLQGQGVIEPFTYVVPGDFSTAAFLIGSALLTDSEVTLRELDLDEPQGDKAFISLVQQMGASLHIDAARRTVTVRRGARLKGIQIDVNDCIDALPMLAVLGCKAEGRTELVNGQMARHKESDRVASMAHALRSMGGHLEERPDGLLISQAPLRGAALFGQQDHRQVLALATAAFAADGPSTIEGVEWASKTYPDWEKDFRSLGARIE